MHPRHPGTSYLPGILDGRRFVHEQLIYQNILMMLEKLEELPSYVAAFKATGEVDRKEYQRVLIPEIERVDKEHGHIHFLMVLETPVKNFSAGAWIQDAVEALKHFRGWKKIAMVTDESGIQKIADLFSVLLPGATKGFSLAQLDEAKRWVSAE